MHLQDALDQINALDDEDVIFAKKPWHMGSEAAIARLDSSLKTPSNLAQLGFEYFIEATLAKEVLSVLKQRPVSEERRRALVLFYAENDAYPDWAYEP
jgi:hypothetical protein